MKTNKKEKNQQEKEVKKVNQPFKEKGDEKTLSKKSKSAKEPSLSGKIKDTVDKPKPTTKAKKSKPLKGKLDQSTKESSDDLKNSISKKLQEDENIKILEANEKTSQITSSEENLDKKASKSSFENEDLAKKAIAANKKENKRVAKATKTTSAKKKLRKKNKKVENKSDFISNELKEAAKMTFNKLAEELIPDKDEIVETAKSILPDKSEINKTADTIKQTISSGIDEISKTVDEGFSEEKISKKKGKANKKENKAHSTSSASKNSAFSLFSDYDVHLFKEGKHYHLYKKFGSHLVETNDTKGVYFAVWAPNAAEVTVIGDFNNWEKNSNKMIPREDSSGIWEVFIPGLKEGSVYKYFIRSNSGYEAEKGDPFAFKWEIPPSTASIVWDLKSSWEDVNWLTHRKNTSGKAQPMSVYEMHLGSWKRVPEDGNRSLSYREMADELPQYLSEMGFTHVEFMPVMEHPFFGSWGYQITGYFATSSRFGSPEDFMYLIDRLHQEGIGVILDWVPSHFPGDLHGIHFFDGTYLYEHEDPQKGFHPDWQSYIFNYGRNEVRSFLISNAVFWLDKFHVDGLRVDAVASMLYLDYSRKEGEWIPNKFGGNEDLDAIDFLKQFNEVVYAEFPDIITIAEESTAWPMVSKPTYVGGLGFGMKWMMGWMHDTLEYFQKDPIHRKHHQNTITFSSNYAFTENFMLPLSHDEVVYGKHSLWNKMPGDEWNKFANLRNMYAYMFAHPGTKLLFMGAEFAQATEWNHDSSLDWHVTHNEANKGVQHLVKELNTLYTSEPALYEKSFSAEGFEWVDFHDSINSVISFLRKGENPEDTLLIVCNFTSIPRENYRIGLPTGGKWKEIFNSDDNRYGGSGMKNHNGIEAEKIPLHGREFSVSLTLPPMGVIYIKNINA